MEIIRDILVYFEESPDLMPIFDVTKLPPHDPEQVAYNLGLLVDDGHIRGHYVADGWNSPFRGKGLSTKGHDFAVTLQDPDVWRETKSKLGDGLGRVTFEVMVATAVAVAKQQIKERTGLNL